MGNLFIKHESDGSYTDAETVYGCIMGDDFISNLDGVPPLKDFITFSSRLLDGKDILTVPVRYFWRQRLGFQNKKEQFYKFPQYRPRRMRESPRLARQYGVPPCLHRQVRILCGEFLTHTCCDFRKIHRTRPNK